MSESGPLTQADALAVLRRTTDPNWLQGMLDQPDGLAIINSKTAVAAAASDAVMRQVAACSIASAPTGRCGIADLWIWRPIDATTALIPAGFTFIDSRGVEMQVAQDISVAVGQQDILLPLVSARRIDLVNNPEPAFDDTLVWGAWVDDIISPVSPPVLDSGGNPLLVIGSGMAEYTSSTPITNAEMDWLSMHGEERGYRRQDGEDGEAYRLRVRAIPTAATPTAVQEAVHGASAQANLPTVYMVEPYRDQATDAARLALSLVFADSVFGDEDYWDDGIGANLVGKLPFRTLEMPDLRAGRAYFRQSVAGQLLEPDGSGFYFDDAYWDDPVWGFPDAGLHHTLVAALHGIQEEARLKRAGGVQFDTYLENATRLDAVGEDVAPPGGVILWTLTAAPGTAWLIRQGLITVNGPGGPGLPISIDPATDSYQLGLLRSDMTFLVSPLYSNIDGMPLRTFELERIGYFGEPIVAISLGAYSTVGAQLRAVGTFWTTLMTL